MCAIEDEILGAMVPDAILRQRAAAGSNYAVKFLSGTQGFSFIISMDAAEIAKQLANVDQYKLAHGLK